MTVKFLNAQRKRGYPISLYLKWVAEPEKNSDLMISGNPTLPAPAIALVTPNLINAAIRLRFFNSSDRLKTATATPLLIITSFTAVYNLAANKSAIAVITGAQNATWKPGEIWYQAEIQPVGGEWISEDYYSGSFVLVA